MNGIQLIAAERQRQWQAEGFSFIHDDGHTDGSLSEAGAAYAKVASAQVRGAEAHEFPADMMITEGEWPWDAESWKPAGDPLRNLIKAGALIAAEIDRLLRHNPHPGAPDAD